MRKSKALGKLIYTSRSGIKVEENKHYRWVSFDEDMIQSMIDLKHPEKIVLPYIEPFITFAKEFSGLTLLLGLGGGACVHALLGTPLHVVEASNEMIAIARKYFKLPQHEELRIKSAKAQDYILQNQLKYHHLLIDLGDKNGFPQDCCDPIFFQKCLDALTEDGFLCINFAKFEDAKKINDYLKAELNLKTLCVKMQGNYLIHYSKKHTKNEILNHFKKNFTIITHTWDSHNGEILNIKKQKRSSLALFFRFKKSGVRIGRFVS